MAKNYLPHFSRIFSANFAGTVFRFILAISFIMFLLSPTTALSPFERIKLTVIENPQDPTSRLNLAKTYEALNDFESAKRELLIGLNYNRGNKELDEELQKIERIQSEPQRILAEIQKWEKITRDFPAYRDAYLKLAQLYYTIYQNDKAKGNLNKALELDPNFEPSREIKEILSSGR